MRWQKLFIRRDCDVPTFSGVILTAYAEIWNMTRQKKEYLFGHFKDKHFHYYYQGIDKWEIGRNLYKKRFAKPNQIIKAYKAGNEFLKQTSAKTGYWKKHLDSKENMAAALNDFQHDFDFVNIHYSISAWWALEAWQNDFMEIVGKLVEKRQLQSQYEKVIGSILKPWKETAITEIGWKISKGASVKELLKQYQFLRSWTMIWYKPLTAAWIKSAANNPARKEKLYSERELLKLLRPNKKEKAYFTQASYISFFKDWRDDLRRHHAFEWNFLFAKIAKRFKADIHDLGYFTLDELAIAIQEGKLNTRLLKTRKGKEFIFTVASGKIKPLIIPGVPAKYRRAITEAESINKEAIVRGIVAQVGVVRGRVRVVRNHHDIKKVEPKEILIVNTTHPDYLQGMKKAAAFVTDEGGIVSHAAIVAREFKKPCIVGTKIATKIFKDGDIVEVDANNGIVRLVETKARRVRKIR